jgi:hypothetical protein
MPDNYALAVEWNESCKGMGMERIEVIPTDEFGPCAVQMERTDTGGVWLYQGDARIYVGNEHLTLLALAILPPTLG